MTAPESWPEQTLLGGLSEATVKELLTLGSAMVYSPHRTLLHQGDPGRHVLLITKGVVKVVTASENGYDMLTAVRVAGDLVGEMAAFEDRPRSGSVIAASEVTANIIRREELEAFLIQHPSAMRAVFRMLSIRLRFANRRRLDFRAYAAGTRLARVLGELTRTYGYLPTGADSERRVVSVAITQEELASLAGIALNTAQKALASLSQQGVIDRQYGRIIVNDVGRLLKVAEMSPQNPY